MLDSVLGDSQPVDVPIEADDASVTMLALLDLHWKANLTLHLLTDDGEEAEDADS